MKKILITGKNSYIGNEVEKWLHASQTKYNIVKISVREDNWKEQKWDNYDAIIHVAGIAHNSNNSDLKQQYYDINTCLTSEIGKKAKHDGVKHFINLSSIIIFGTKSEIISPDTIPNPDNFYGDSKLRGEDELNKLKDSDFLVTHIRPPMVYGKGAKGNFPMLVKLAKVIPFFPSFNNQRSMIYIKNLAEFIRLVIDNQVTGNLHPKNKALVSTTYLVKEIAKANNHKIKDLNLLNNFIKKNLENDLFKKVFGSLYYSQNMSEGNLEYQVYGLEESIDDIFK